MLWWRQGYAVDEKYGFCGNLGRLRIHTEWCCGVTGKAENYMPTVLATSRVF